MNYLAVMAAAALLGLTACNEEAALTQPAEPQNPPVADNSGNVYITGDDFTWELGGGSEGGGEGDASSVGAVTRSQLIVDGNTAKFTWTPGDRVGILPDQGAQVWFEIPTPEEGEEPTNVAAFDGGAWALKPTSDYAAYYPFVKDFDLDRTAVPVSYTGQAQTGNGSTAHLGAYDYQGARPSTTNGAGGVSFDFDHVGALVLLQFTVPTSGTQLTGVTLSAGRRGLHHCGNLRPHLHRRLPHHPDGDGRKHDHRTGLHHHGRRRDRDPLLPLCPHRPLGQDGERQRGLWRHGGRDDRASGRRQEPRGGRGLSDGGEDSLPHLRG